MSQTLTAQAWQPIATAPLVNFDLVLLFWGDDFGSAVEPGFWDDGTDEDGNPYEAATWYRIDSDSVGPCEPTHWMPMPAAPVAQVSA